VNEGLDVILSPRGTVKGNDEQNLNKGGIHCSKATVLGEKWNETIQQMHMFALGAKLEKDEFTDSRHTVAYSEGVGCQANVTNEKKLVQQQHCWGSKPNTCGE
jgi:hypothetical protein